MIFQNMEFHNVECLEERLGGYMLQRFPEEVRFGLGYQDHDRGRMFSQMPVGCEIRFVTDAHFFRISLASYEKDNRIFVFRGNFAECFRSSRGKDQYVSYRGTGRMVEYRDRGFSGTPVFFAGLADCHG